MRKRRLPLFPSVSGSHINSPSPLASRRFPTVRAKGERPPISPTPKEGLDEVSLVVVYVSRKGLTAADADFNNSKNAQEDICRFEWSTFFAGNLNTSFPSLRCRQNRLSFVFLLPPLAPTPGAAEEEEEEKLWNGREEEKEDGMGWLEGLSSLALKERGRVGEKAGGGGGGGFLAPSPTPPPKREDFLEEEEERKEGEESYEFRTVRWRIAEFAIGEIQIRSLCNQQIIGPL